MPQPADAILFVATTPLDFAVRTTIGYWAVITTIKHPVMVGREPDVRATLEAPDEIRRSRSDPNIYLFYGTDGPRRWVCAVARREAGDGFLVTAYRTSAIKEGVRIWPT